MEWIMAKSWNSVGTIRLFAPVRTLTRALLLSAFILGIVSPAQVRATVFGYASTACLGPSTTNSSNLDSTLTVSNASANILSGTCPTVPTGSFSTADATSSADMTTGQLKINVGAVGNTAASARAGFGDVITVIPTSGFSDAFFSFTAKLEIAGNVSGNADAGGTLQLIPFGNATGGQLVTGEVICTADPTVCSPLSQTPGGSVDQILLATVDVPTNNLQVFIQETFFAAVNCINSNCLSSQSGGSDFSHTAQLSLILPAGFTFTSDSGVLLSNAPTPSVPEPSTLPLLVTGLLGLAGMARRSRRWLPYC